MKLHIIRHVDFEDEGAIAEWAAEKGHSVSRTLLYKGETLPAHDAYDLLVVMGGPMNIYEEKEYPFLAPEKRFLKEAVLFGKKVLGICLGAQLLADVLGGRVYKGIREIGFHRIDLAGGASQAKVFFDFPDRFTAFHWHGDTFHLPEGAMHIASSAACFAQAFTWKDRVVGLQFHLETTPASMERLIANCASEIEKREYVQTSEEMRATVSELAGTRILLWKLLDRLADL
jgi:GMP synthase-like glutamine amidotransferase